MKNTELPQYDEAAEHISLQQAKAVSPQAYRQRLKGIVNDRASAENESLHPHDAFWSSEYKLGVDGRGNAALVTSELGMIPGRAHRNDSNAMSDSMVRNAAYTFDRIQKGLLPHVSWRSGIEQIRQFRAFQKEAVTLADGESMLGYAMNGTTTRDGIALFLITRDNKTFHFETRLIGGMSEGAAKDLLDRFSSSEAAHVSLQEGNDSPLYSVMRGTIAFDLKDKQKIAFLLQDVLDKRHETPSETIILGSCRKKAVQQEDNKEKKHIHVQTDQIIGKQRYDQLIKPLVVQGGVPLIHNKQAWGEQKVIWDQSVRPWIVSMQQPMVIKELPKVRKPEYIITPKLKQDVEKVMTINIPSVKELQHTPTILYQARPKPTRVLEPIVKQKEEQTQETRYIEAYHETKRPEVTVPIATFLVATDSKIAAHVLPQYKEKSIAISLAAHAHTQVKHIIGEHMPVVDHVSIEMEFQKENEHHIVYEVDELVIMDMERVIDSIGTSIQQSESVKTVMKLLWVMPSQHEGEFVPVEEVEIAQDSNRTLQNLLHFLRKVVHKYVGNDTIRERIVQRIASDKWDDEISEIESYLEILKTQRFRGHLFAVVN